MSKRMQFANVVGFILLIIALLWIRWDVDARVRSLEASAGTSGAVTPKAKAAPAAPIQTYVFTTDPFTDVNLRKVYLKRSLTEKNAGVLAALQKRVAVPFDKATPLSNFIQYIKTSTIAPERPEGVSIYVDPVGLDEAEKSDESPIRLAVSDVTLAQGLELGLSQLGMTYWVEDDGLVVISAAYSKQAEESRDSDLDILEQIQHLRDEIAALRLETAAMRGALPEQSFRRGGMAGVPIGPEGPRDFK
jgi:hypothetical protein